MKNIASKIIAAVNAAGIECRNEYDRTKTDTERGAVRAFAGLKKIRLERLRDGAADIAAEVRVTVQAFGGNGALVRLAAENDIIPAVMECGEEIFGAEMSEIFHDIKTDRTYCEITFELRKCGFAADRCSVSFGGVKIYVEEYGISRSAASGETLLTDGSTEFFNGGAKTAKIKFRGTAETPCADKLDELLRNKTVLTLVYAGMSFDGAVLTAYSCGGKNGSSERADVEFDFAEALSRPEEENEEEEQ